MKIWDWVFGALCVAWLLMFGLVAGVFDVRADDTPAWVQAIGSILAILVAVAVAGWQNRRNQQLSLLARRSARFERIAPLRALVNAAVDLAAEAQSDFGWLEDRWETDFWNRIETELEEISIMSVADYAIARDLLELQRCFSGLRWTLGVLHGRYIEDMERTGPPVDEEDRDFYRSHRAKVLAAGARISSRLIALEVPD